MGAHAGDHGVGVGARQLRVDVDVELLEALVAEDLGLGWTEKAGDDAVVFGSGNGCLPLPGPRGHAALGEPSAEAAPGVVERLVQRAAWRGQAFGEHVDRDAVDRKRDQDLALVGRELVGDAFAGGAQRFAAFGGGVRLLGCGGEAVPAVGVEHELAGLPRATTHADAGLEERELVRPRREAACAAEVVALGEDGNERVVGCLGGEVVELLAACEREAGPAPGDLEPRGAQQQRVQAGDGGAVSPGAGYRRRRPRSARRAPRGPHLLPERKNASAAVANES